VNGLRQMWLVALREMRERSRSRAFRASLVLMILVVVAMVVLPSVLDSSAGKDIGITGAVPDGLSDAIQSQSDAVGIEAVIDRYADLPTGQQAVRDGDIDVLIVDAERLEWRRDVDQQLHGLVTGAIQVVAVRERAAQLGISPADMAVLLAPVPITNAELGQVEGRSPDDETAAFLMTVLLFMAISTYGAMVMSGVVEEKTSRVVEVLLARVPARNLLAGKIAGIGLLGLGQIALTVLVAVVSLTMVDSVDVPAARGTVLAWVVVWFVLGYALYATVFGALGALASRAEDAQSAAGPVSVVLVAAYFVSFAAIGSPDAGWAKLVSYFPATAPLAMPNRMAMGATAWWEPLLAVAITVAAIAGLVVFGGRVYSAGVLHSGPTLTVRAAYRGITSPDDLSSGTPRSHRVFANALRGRSQLPSASANGSNQRWTSAAVVAVGVAIALAVAAVTRDVVVGLAAGAGSFAVGTRVVRSRADREGLHHSHR